MHIVRTYLPITENWLFHLLHNTPNTKQVIFAERLENEIFSIPEFTIHLVTKKHIKTSNNIFFRIVKKVMRWWVVYFKGIYTKQLHSIIQKENPDIIHVHFGNIALMYLPVFKRIKTPLLVSFYGYDYNAFYNYKSLFQRVNYCICEGPAGREQLISLGCPVDKIIIIPLGIVPSLSLSSKIKNQGNLKLVQIAAFNEKKGYIYTVKAFEKALSSCPNMKLTLIGPDSPIKDKIKDYIKDHQLSSSITIKNTIPPHVVEKELAQYDVFIHPSVLAANGDNEGGAPVVLLQAQACGLPIIATFHMDIPFYVIHRETGLLVPEKDIDSLSNSISSFYYMQEEDFQDFSKNAIKHVEKNFNITQNALKLKEFYHQQIKLTHIK